MSTKQRVRRWKNERKTVAGYPGLTETATGFHQRIRLPKDVRHAFPDDGGELRFTLGSDKQAAKDTSRRLKAEYDVIFERIRSGKPLTDVSTALDRLRTASAARTASQQAATKAFYASPTRRDPAELERVLAALYAKHTPPVADAEATLVKSLAAEIGVTPEEARKTFRAFMEAQALAPVLKAWAVEADTQAKDKLDDQRVEALDLSTDAATLASELSDEAIILAERLPAAVAGPRVPSRFRISEVDKERIEVRGLRASTAKSQASFLKRWIQMFGDSDVRTVTPDTIITFRTELLNDPKLSVKRAAQHLEWTGFVFAFAKSNNLISVDPTNEVTLPKQPKRLSERKRPFTPRQMADIREAVQKKWRDSKDKRTRSLYWFVMTAAYMGLREDEL
jgi:hypothetical protein